MNKNFICSNVQAQSDLRLLWCRVVVRHPLADSLKPAFIFVIIPRTKKELESQEM